MRLELPEPIIEIGARRHPSQDKMANLRDLFPGRAYIGCDMEAGPGVDRIENLEKLTFKNGEVGTFILCDTLEHVRDLGRAMMELQRCMHSEHGVLIATSVMLFPVHGFPNDYWRFTPEGFRDLARGFRWVYTFYGGDPSFPHTVAFIASRRQLQAVSLEGLLQSVTNLSPVPHHSDRKSAMMTAGLANLLLQQVQAAGQQFLSAHGQVAGLMGSGWVLTPGDWMRVVLHEADTFDAIELIVSGRVLQVVDRKNCNCLLAEPESGYSETAFLFDPHPETPDQVGQIEAYLVAPSGQRTLLARTAPGVILPQAELPHRLILHSVDENAASPVIEHAITLRARTLLRELQERGEKVVLDLGCGFRKAGNIGIDASATNTHADLICLLGFESLPFADSVVDEVVCRDFLEHIPKAVFLETKGCMHYPVMQLMDEIWRVLKPGGIFRSWTPMYPHAEVFQDPTHLSVWTIKSMDYFCGTYAVAREIYGIRACFEKIDVREDEFYLYAELRKPIA